MQCANGASEMVSSVTSPLWWESYIIFNYSNMLERTAFASYGVLMYVQFVLPQFSLDNSMWGSAPIISYHYGAEKHGGVEKPVSKVLF